MRPVGPNHQRGVIAFDGDDTLWRCDPKEVHWEQRYERLSAGCRFTESCKARFKAGLTHYGYSVDGVIAAYLDARQIQDAQKADELRLLAQDHCFQPAEGALDLLATCREKGYRLWLITRGDLLLQALKLASFSKTESFDVVEIVSQKNRACYQQILHEHGCSPDEFTMVGDSFWQDIYPVVKLGGRAFHVPKGRWRLMAPLCRILPATSITVCQHLSEVSHCISNFPLQEAGRSSAPFRHRASRLGDQSREMRE